MSSRLQNVLDAALDLSTEERASLAEELLRSLDGPLPTPAEQAEIDAAWEAEIRRRMADVKAGRTQLLDGEEVMRKLRAGERP